MSILFDCENPAMSRAGKVRSYEFINSCDGVGVNKVKDRHDLHETYPQLPPLASIMLVPECLVTWSCWTKCFD